VTEATDAEVKKKENQVSRELTDLLGQRCDESFPRVSVGHLKEVLIGVTCGVRKKKPVLLVQSAEQDIVFSLRDDENEYRVDPSGFLQSFPKSLPEGTITVPLVIFEVKYQGVNTHVVRLYSETARLVKAIFPFCSYNLVLIDIKSKKEPADRTYMAAKHFDRVIYKPNYSKDPSAQSELVEELWKLAVRHIEYLKEEPFFGLGDVLQPAAE
jgi:hypothetical protein